MPTQGARTSPYLQDKLALLGCLTVYKQVPELVEKLLGIDVNQAQVYRICQALAQALPEAPLNAPSPGLKHEQNQPEAVVYGMVDAGPPCGSMIFTDLGWQETKLGRVFVAQPLRSTPQSMSPIGDIMASLPLPSNNYCRP